MEKIIVIIFASCLVIGMFSGVAIGWHSGLHGEVSSSVWLIPVGIAIAFNGGLLFGYWRGK